MIVDASVGVALIAREGNWDACSRAVADGPLIVPPLFHVEVANALWKKIRRDEAVAHALLAAWQEAQLLFTTFAQDGSIERALELAVELGHPVYDCVYLAMAEATGEMLLTLDRRLADAVAPSAHAARVTLIRGV